MIKTAHGNCVGSISQWSHQFLSWSGWVHELLHFMVISSPYVVMAKRHYYCSPWLCILIIQAVGVAEILKFNNYWLSFITSLEPEIGAGKVKAKFIEKAEAMQTFQLTRIFAGVILFAIKFSAHPGRHFHPHYSIIWVQSWYNLIGIIIHKGVGSFMPHPHCEYIIHVFTHVHGN